MSTEGVDSRLGSDVDANCREAVTKVSVCRVPAAVASQRELYGRALDIMNIMQGMKSKRIPLAVSLLVIGLTPMAIAASTCNVKDKVPATARIFARISGNGSWHEYRSVDQIPQLALDSGSTAQVLQRRKGVPSVTIVEPGEDFWLYTRYCYNDEGQLDGVTLELRTSLGWGHRVEGTVSGDEFVAGRSEFFDTKNGKPVARPLGVADAPAELKPTLYMRVSELPFASLLQVSTKSRRQPGVELVSERAGN